MKEEIRGVNMYRRTERNSKQYKMIPAPKVTNHKKRIFRAKT